MSRMAVLRMLFWTMYLMLTGLANGGVWQMNIWALVFSFSILIVSCSLMWVSYAFSPFLMWFVPSMIMILSWFFNVSWKSGDLIWSLSWSMVNMFVGLFHLVPVGSSICCRLESAISIPCGSVFCCVFFVVFLAALSSSCS